MPSLEVGRPQIKTMVCPTAANFSAAVLVLAGRDDTKSLHHRNSDGGANGHGRSQRTSLWPTRVFRPELSALLPGSERGRRFPEPGGAFRIQPDSGQHANAPARPAAYGAGAPHVEAGHRRSRYSSALFFGAAFLGALFFTAGGVQGVRFRPVMLAFSVSMVSMKGSL